MQLEGKDEENQNPSESNEIDNVELKESLAERVLRSVVNSENYYDLNNTEIEFGYLFVFEDSGIETLMKISNDKITNYYSVQNETLYKLHINEDTYLAMIETFMDFHA